MIEKGKAFFDDQFSFLNTEEDYLSLILNKDLNLDDLSPEHLNKYNSLFSKSNQELLQVLKSEKLCRYYGDEYPFFITNKMKALWEPTKAVRISSLLGISVFFRQKGSKPVIGFGFAAINLNHRYIKLSSNISLRINTNLLAGAIIPRAMINLDILVFSNKYSVSEYYVLGLGFEILTASVINIFANFGKGTILGSNTGIIVEDVASLYFTGINIPNDVTKLISNVASKAQPFIEEYVTKFVSPSNLLSEAANNAFSQGSNVLRLGASNVLSFLGAENMFPGLVVPEESKKPSSVFDFGLFSRFFEKYESEFDQIAGEAYEYAAKSYFFSIYFSTTMYTH